MSLHLENGIIQSCFFLKVSLINFFKSLSEFSILAASWINTYFALIFDFKSAFLTLNVLVLPPFMSSILSIINFFKILLFLITKVIFLNPIFFKSSILCSRMVLSFIFDKSLFSFALNLVLLPAARSTK